MAILNQNQFTAFLNTYNTNAGTFPGTATSLYYGLSVAKGIINLVDGATTVSTVLSNIQGANVVSAVYTSATAEVDGVVTYNENATLVVGNTYYFTLTQVIPGLAGAQNQTIQNLISYSIPTGGAITKGTVATALAAVINATLGYKVTTSVNTSGSYGILTVTASAGYPLLSGGNVDQYATSLVQTTTGVQSVGYKADLINNYQASINSNWVSTNTYDRCVIVYNSIVNGITTTYQVTVWLNSTGTGYAQIKSALQPGNSQSLFNYSGVNVYSAWQATGGAVLSKE